MGIFYSNRSYRKYKILDDITYIELTKKSFNIAAQIVDAYNTTKELLEEWKPSIGLRHKQLLEQPVFSVTYHLNSKFTFWFDRKNV